MLINFLPFPLSRPWIEGLVDGIGFESDISTSSSFLELVVVDRRPCRFGRDCSWGANSERGGIGVGGIKPAAVSFIFWVNSYCLLAVTSCRWGGNVPGGSGVSIERNEFHPMRGRAPLGNVISGTSPICRNELRPRHKICHPQE